MEINGIKYYTLQYLIDNEQEIPSKSGIYYWVYWPAYKKGYTDAEIYLKKLYDFSEKSVHLSEHFVNFKYKVVVKETEIIDLNSENKAILGLSHKRSDCLKSFLKNDIDNLDFFVNFFKKVCFMKPFYIGKANNLRERLKQHFKEQTHVLRILREQGIYFNDIWIGFDLVDFPNDELLNLAFEEIIQRIVKPGLTKKPG